ncbi:MAG: OmpA family protein [Prevotella sp.]
MKKQILALAVAVAVVQALPAQTVEDSKLSDNWYIGINGGENFKTTNTNVFSNLNPSFGLRIGRYLTPVFGMAVEGEAYLNNKGSENRPLGTVIKGINVSLLGTTNFSNLFGGYPGEPRVFEIVGIYGLGWGHVFSTRSNRPTDNNILTSKLGVDFNFNIGQTRAWQIYIEPNISYGLNVDGSKTKFNLNKSALGLLVGINYKFGNSNGTHNFVLADLRDQMEIDALLDRINEMRSETNARDMEIESNRRTIANLEMMLAERQPTVVVNETKTTNVLQPSVIFRKGMSTIDAAQYASISMIATYMKNHPEAQILIKGYASPEGNKELNQRLSEARAKAVKNALVKRYGISADRLTTKGMGATDELFDELEFNRVVTFIDTSK